MENPVCVEDTSFYINTLLLLTEHDVPLSKKYVSEAYRLSTEFANKRLLIQSGVLWGVFTKIIIDRIVLCIIIERHAVE